MPEVSRRLSDRELFEAMQDPANCDHGKLIDEFFYRLSLATEQTIVVPSIQELGQYLLDSSSPSYSDILLKSPQIIDEVVSWCLETINVIWDQAAEKKSTNKVAAMLSDRVLGNEFFAQRATRSLFEDVSLLEFANSCAEARGKWGAIEETVAMAQENTVNDADRIMAFADLPGTGLIGDLRDFETARCRYERSEKLLDQGTLNLPLYRISHWLERNAKETAELCRMSGYSDIDENRVLQIDRINQIVLSR